MSYEEFDKKYNKRDYRGVIQECSIIDLDGNIIFHGTFDEMGDYHDSNAKPIWQNNKLVGWTIDGKEVITTNLANHSWYRSPDFAKLHFEVELVGYELK